MLSILSELEEDIFDAWVSKVSKICTENLSKTLLNIRTDLFLELNFDPKVILLFITVIRILYLTYTFRHNVKYKIIY